MTVINISSWGDFKQQISLPGMQSWVYRGQSDQRWPLLSAIARYLVDFRVHKNAWPYQEERLLRVFKRKAHHFLQHLPQEDDAFEWLALMQHFGTPTRLLDFSFCPYVAAFFALHRATCDSAVWALFPPAFDHEGEIRLLDGATIRPKELWMRD